MSLREEIKTTMLEQSITASAVSEKTGIDKSLLSRFFAEKSALSLKSLNALLDALGYELTIRRKKQKVVLEHETAREK
jgi:transcriptional regulator with XRE-family HTH domain